MPIDLDGIVIIDLMLDSVIELCLLPDTWTEQEMKILSRLHVVVLRMNASWMEEDYPSGDFLHDFKGFYVSVRGYIDLLHLVISNAHRETLIPKLAKLPRYANLIAEKLDFLNEHYRYSS